MPKDKKAFYFEHIVFGKYHCLIIQNNRQQAKRAILYFFGGGMMLGSDKGDVSVAGSLQRKRAAMYGSRIIRFVLTTVSRKAMIWHSSAIGR